MWDVFICHASEDKDIVARPLARVLGEEGLNVWYDEFTLTVGDSLRRKIDEGLAKSRYGVVVLSHAFFGKKWPNDELDGLAAKEINGEKVILPVWWDVEYEDVASYSPTLAGRLAAKASDEMDEFVADLMAVIRPGDAPASAAPAAADDQQEVRAGTNTPPIHLDGRPRERAGVSDPAALVGPRSEGLDAISLARRLAMQGREPPLNSVGRLTRSAIRETISPLVGELNERPAPEGVARDGIAAAAQPYLSAVAPSLQKLEQFALACVEEGWIPGVKMVTRLAGELMTIEESRSGRRVRFAVGAPQFLAFRLLVWMGARAMLDDQFEPLRVVLNEPIESRDSTGRSSHLSLPVRRDLFWSEAFLGHADITAMSLGNAWGDNRQIQAFFGGETEYRESLGKFLMVLSLFQPHKNDQHLLYPGYQLISGARRAMESLVGRLQSSNDYRKQMATTFGEEIENFETSWGDRARRANSQEPGSQHWLLDLAKFPEDLTPPT